ncbi:DUF4893 domain-containing protein [Sphingomonas sp. ID1715]|uniref:DUF4893 domain-containing protein n=1 Tax=Sphingomonas sp. ID1715 TaxID=1656898 RepID=UPI0014888582|nr:DUF4893 domain-containing protein [Sphingomonas sp. ID1715]NNM76867.1 DUF4893 domain-containing protein [Sphingomonas sp. ID1715]
MTGRVALIVLLMLAPGLSSCALFRAAPAPAAPAAMVEVVEDPVPLEWASVATERDRARLAALEQSWSQALASARRFRRAMAGEGALLAPDAAQPRAAPTPGTYICRVIKLGGRPAFAAFRPFHCYVEAEGELLTLVKGSGSQRPAGRLWADGDTRMVFLGAMGFGAEDPPAYGEDASRDVAGRLERVAPFRWRLVIPDPGDGALLDVYELIPSVPLDP